MNRDQLEALRTIRKYLAHPDVQAMPFALPASNPLRALDAIIEQGEKEQELTQLPFEGKDMENAKSIARAMGYGDSTSYSSSSALVGLFFQGDRAGMREGCIIKTKELGFLVVSTLEDMHDVPSVADNWQELNKNK